jgi:hypothetical protein
MSPLKTFTEEYARLLTAFYYHIRQAPLRIQQTREIFRLLMKLLARYVFDLFSCYQNEIFVPLTLPLKVSQEKQIQKFSSRFFSWVKSLTRWMQTWENEKVYFIFRQRHNKFYFTFCSVVGCFRVIGWHESRLVSLDFFSFFRPMTWSQFNRQFERKTFLV